MPPPALHTVKVTFKDAFPIEIVDSLVESEFLGFGIAYRHEDRRVIYVKPNPERYSDLLEQLDAWERQGLVSFAEEAR